MSVTANGNTVKADARESASITSTFRAQARPAIPTGSATAAGGTSGISIDNSLTGAGESQIYYTTLSSQTCAGNGTTGSGNGQVRDTDLAVGAVAG